MAQPHDGAGDAPISGDQILYQTAQGTIRVEVLDESETFWQDQRRIAELFGVTVPTISHHLKTIYESGELSRKTTVRRFLTVPVEGGHEVRHEIELHSLDAIISVGYRVNSAQATPTAFSLAENRRRWRVREVSARRRSAIAATHAHPRNRTGDQA